MRKKCSYPKSLPALIFCHFLFTYFPHFRRKIRKYPLFFKISLSQKKLIFKTSSPFVYILNNSLILLSTLLSLFQPIYHNYVLKSINSTLKSMHYVNTSNIYFADLLFIVYFFFFFFPFLWDWNKEWTI